MNTFLQCRRLLFFILLLASVSGCEPKLQQLTDEEALRFAKEIEATIKKRDGTLLDNAFDKEVFVKRMNLPNSTDSRSFEKGIKDKLTLGTQISNALSDQDNFEFIRHYVKDGKHHAIFRLYSAKESALNYHDYELIKKGNECRIADAYIYMSGETLSETIANMYNGLFEKSRELDKKTSAGMGDLADIKRLVQRGKNEEAKRMYDALPAYLKESKAVLLVDVLICSSLSNEEYSVAIDKLREKFPNEPNMNLVMIDGYFLQKDYVKMLGAVNALDSQINKDPLLDFYRYLSYNLLKDDKNARIYLERLVKNMPDFQRGYLELIATELGEKNKVAADSVISIYRKKPKFDQEALDNLLAYY